MIIVMNPEALREHIEKVIDKLQQAGFDTHLSQGVERTIIGAIGDKREIENLALEAMPGVERVVPISKPYKLVSREFKPDNTIVKVGDLEIGGDQIHVMAGPCSVESRDQVLETAKLVKAAGATILRGGAFKPRTSPYSFQGLQEEGLKLLAEAREVTGLPVITEVMDARDLELGCYYADIIQIGARNMQNFSFLKEVAKTQKPVMLKRGPSASIEEWMQAAEYLLAGGNFQVMLCERGIRTFENFTRNTLDLSAVPSAKLLTHLPVIVDPSHGTGKWRLVTPMARAAIAAGADGLIVEVHPRPEEALSDGPQSLTPENFKLMMEEVTGIAKVLRRNVAQPKN